MTGGGAPRVALVTYSSKPRGGVVHSLHLAEALRALGHPVHLFALGDPAAGFFRPTDAAHTLLPAPAREGTLEQRVFWAIDALADGLRPLLREGYDLVHVQDCIAASAALRLRTEGLALPILRTVHHVDDFTTPALVECQRRSIVEPDHLLVVSEFWRRELRRDYGVDAVVVPNGVDAGRFHRSPGAPDLRRRVGADGRFVFLTVGGIEPRKGSLELFEAAARLKAGLSPPPLLVIVGGHSFQDHTPYRRRALGRARRLGLEEGEDWTILGTVPDEDLPAWYWSADAFVLPSVKEGWGLAVLEAMAAGLPVVATDIPVFREYLTDGEAAVLVPPGDAPALAAAMRRLATDASLRRRLAESGPAVASRFSWAASAAVHADLYRRVAAPTGGRDGRPGATGGAG